MDDIELHHLFDLIRDDQIRFRNYRHVELDGTDIDDLIYAAEDAGHVTVHPGGVVKTTEKGRRWRGRNHRPGPISVVFQQAGVS